MIHIAIITHTYPKSAPRPKILTPFSAPRPALRPKKHTPTPASRSETPLPHNTPKDYKSKKIADTFDEKYIKYKIEGDEQLIIEEHLEKH